MIDLKVRFYAVARHEVVKSVRKVATRYGAKVLFLDGSMHPK